MERFYFIVAFFILSVCVLSVVVLTRCFRKFSFVDRLAGGKKSLKTMIGFAIVLTIILACVLTMGFMNTLVVVLHLEIFWLICELAFLIYRRVNKIEKDHFKRYYAGAAAVVITVVYLAAGFFFAHHVWQTEYQVTTDKLDGTMRIAMFADSHVGATFHGEGFAEHMAELQKSEPDMLIIAGDLVDDDTTKEDMIRCCQALGEFKTKYGTFYAVGNHDRGYFEYRNFSAEELFSQLDSNNVTILRDEALLVDDTFYVIGRRDMWESTSENPRMTMQELTEGLDPSKYMIVIDHQPADYVAQAASGVDLVLSGHTHGGQLLGMNWIMALLGQNNMLKGIKTVDNTTFIVTSGISDWALKFKTGCKSEVVVIDITGR